MHIVADHYRRPARTLAQAAHRFQRKLAVRRRFIEIAAQLSLNMRGQGLRTHRLACLGTAQLHDMLARRLFTKVRIKRNHAMKDYKGSISPR